MEFDEIIAILINVGIPAALSVVFFMIVTNYLTIIKKIETFFKQEEIQLEKEKTDFLLNKYSKLHTNKDLKILKPVKNGGQWIIVDYSNQILNKVILNQLDYTKLKKEGVYENSILKFIRIYDENGKLVTEQKKE